MLRGFEALDSRIHRTHGRRCVEPPGQDGYNCLLLAAIDQLHPLFATADIGTVELRMLVREFLVEWKTLVLDDDWRQRLSDCCPDELITLRDGPDYHEFLSIADTVGNHVVPLAICGVLSKRARTRITAQVLACPLCGKASFMHATLPNALLLTKPSMRQDEEVAAAAKETPSRASQPLIPGGELVYKSSVVAMFDKKESGKKLPIDRLLKMQVAAKRTAEREAKPASADTTPSAQPTEAAVDVEGVSTEPDDHLLRIGSDFLMAVVYSGTGKATRRVAWLGREEKLRHTRWYTIGHICARAPACPPRAQHPPCSCTRAFALLPGPQPAQHASPFVFVFWQGSM